MIPAQIAKRTPNNREDCTQVASPGVTASWARIAAFCSGKLAPHAIVESSIILAARTGRFTWDRVVGVISGKKPLQSNRRPLSF